MNYDRREAGTYDKHLSKAVADAKNYWGSGWANLTPDMRQAFICRALVGSLASIDFTGAFGGKETTEMEQKLLSRLIDMGAVFDAAMRTG